jgi:hypothetical protein
MGTSKTIVMSTETPHIKDDAPRCLLKNKKTRPSTCITKLAITYLTGGHQMTLNIGKIVPDAPSAQFN